MATMASSMTLPIVVCFALPWMLAQRASFGTQKTFSAVYSSLSSGSASFSALRASYRSWKASEMYLRKMRPRTTCLYSAASRLPRSLSAVAQRVTSKPREVPLAGERLVVVTRAIGRYCLSANLVTSNRALLSQRKYSVRRILEANSGSRATSQLGAQRVTERAKDQLFYYSVSIVRLGRFFASSRFTWPTWDQHPVMATQSPRFRGT